jgi:ubiquinone/menaquinone biosynthesis C-methylase UbiE
MAESDRTFAGSIPQLYDRYLGPLIFAGYAAETAKRVAAFAPHRVLETAAGTGIVTRALRAALPAAGVTATDLNQPMLDHAAAQPGAAGVTWRQADAQRLPFADASFDAAVCQFGAMFFPDKIAAYREARRVLGPGGRFFLSVWDRIEDNEFADVVTSAVGRLFPGDPPRFLARTPHGFHDIGAVREDLAAAGFTNMTAETVTLRSRAASARDAAVAYCEGTPLRNEIEARDPARLTEATEAATRALAARFGDGRIDGKIQAHIFTAAA